MYPWGDGGIHGVSTRERCCQPEGDYELVCKCSYGDGWHGGYLEISGQKYCTQFMDGNETTETATMGISDSECKIILASIAPM